MQIILVGIKYNHTGSNVYLSLFWRDFKITE